MNYQVSKMRLTLKKVLQATLLVALFSLSSLAVLRLASSINTETADFHVGSNSNSKWTGRIALVDTASPEQETDQFRGHNVEYSPPVTPPSSTTLEDLFISVKTTKNFHNSRLDVIIKTWFTLAREQTWFFTDSDDEEYKEKTHNHLINTGCSSSHNRMALCCKMAVEFDTFLESNKKWFCHFDDDNYVNVPQLVKMLQDFSWQDDWYLGKPSIKAPLEILDRENMPRKISFWFATGGAGFCLSRSLALKMKPLASGGKFISIGDKIRLPDDVTMGYIVEHMLRKQLTVIDKFHSHLEPMKFLKHSQLTDQISFSYSRYGQEMNVLNLDGFNNQIDPYRFLSLHCLLFPNFSFCPR